MSVSYNNIDAVFQEELAQDPECKLENGKDCSQIFDNLTGSEGSLRLLKLKSMA